MTREELQALGLTDEQVEKVMKIKSRTLDDFQKEIEAKDAELKKYRKGGEYYTDQKEIERLRTFEKDTLEKETNAKKTAALTKLFKSGNASDSVTKLFVSSKKLSEIELDEKGEVKGGAELLKQAKADYADLFGANGDSGVPQGTSAHTSGEKNKNTPFLI